MNETIQVTIAVKNQSIREELIAQLSQHNYDSFEEEDNSLHGYIDAANFSKEILEQVLSRYQLSYKQEHIENQNWNAVWESSFEPVVVDHFCAIRASFHPSFNNVDYELTITPKMSFGTGHHATTYLMISEMRTIDFKDKEVADFGTGTGILAILAEKMGSKKIRAIDIDDWSIENAIENIENNGCNKILVEKKDQFDFEQTFDVILANINKNVILTNVAAMSTATIGNGFVLVSGLLKEDEHEVVEAFKIFKLNKRSTSEKSNWICILFQKG